MDRLVYLGELERKCGDFFSPDYVLAVLSIGGGFPLAVQASGILVMRVLNIGFEEFLKNLRWPGRSSRCLIKDPSYEHVFVVRVKSLHY